jgi:hypothetical protein
MENLLMLSKSAKRTRMAVTTCQSFWGRVNPLKRLGRAVGVQGPLRNLLSLNWPIESGELVQKAYKTFQNSSGINTERHHATT